MKLQNFEFRIWDSENKSLIYNTGSVVGLNPDVHEIELWTGFYDKNGAKIFEGDFVNHEDFEIIHELRYEYGAFVLWQPKNAVPFLWIHEQAKDGKFDFLEIVGNVHESDRFRRVLNFARSF